MEKFTSLGNMRRLGALMLFVLLAVAPAQAQTRQVRIMPLGDSLTSSLNGLDSYRYLLWNKLNASGAWVDFVGSQWGVGDGSPAKNSDFDQNHEGHPGATTEDILYGLPGWLSQSRPDIVLLCIGGNDFAQGSKPKTALTNTREIIRTLRQANPRIVILWGLLPPDPQFPSQTRTYNSGAAQMASALSNKNSPVKIVDLYSYFYPRTDTVDGQHPNATGERKLANRFHKAIMPMLRRF